MIAGTGTAALAEAVLVRAAGCSVAVIDFRPFSGICALRGGGHPKNKLLFEESL